MLSPNQEPEIAGWLPDAQWYNVFVLRRGFPLPLNLVQKLTPYTLTKYLPHVETTSISSQTLTLLYAT